MKTITITVDASAYEDDDDCLDAAVADAMLEYRVSGYDIGARWANEERTQIELDIPRHAYVAYRRAGLVDEVGCIVGEDGTGDVGVCVDAALALDPHATAEDIADGIEDAREEHAANMAADEAQS